MTENKRFYCKKDGNNEWCVSDRLNQFPMPISSLEFCSVVANALNSLWGQVLRFDRYSQEYLQRANNYEDKIDELKYENEQLKHRLKHYEMWFKQEEIREIEIGDWKMKFTSDETE